MRRVRIVQCLCPQRHAIAALPYETEDGAENSTVAAALRVRVESLVSTGLINPWCGICNSRVWKYEDRQTRYETMERAKPHHRRAERADAIAREFFRGSRL